MALGLKYKNQEHIFEEKTVDGVPYLAYPLLEKTGAVRHGFSTRLGGVSTGHCATMNISTTRGDDPAAVEDGDQCARDLSGDLLRGLCSVILRGSGTPGDRAVPFGMARYGR